MNRILVNFLALLGFSFFACTKAQQRPNIVVIMADDMGYSDIGCYGGEINTPNLDQLAENGVKFSQFYNAARCCPTRASLMTGQYPHQTGIGHMTNTPDNPKKHDHNVPGYRGFLNRECVTIAEVLKEANYNTLMAGKWHLGYHGQEKWPLQRGFDKYYGIISGASSFFNPQPPRGLTLGNEAIQPEGDNYYTTDAFTNYATKFIKDINKENNNPFFLYLAYTSPHWPMHAPEEDIAKYEGKYDNGWAKLRESRLKKMIKLGLVDPLWELSPQDSREWDSLTAQKRLSMGKLMAIYAAMVNRMDQNIGKVVSTLKEIGELDNTIIIFLSDNGGCAEGGELGGGDPFNVDKNSGQFPKYGRAWANASNTPYRKYKHYVHEGGISTPLIVHWPEGIAKEVKGKIIDQYAFLPDIMSTCVDLANTKYPTEYKGNKINPSSGKSLKEVLSGKSQAVHTEPIFWEHEGNRCVRLGKYKLVSTYQKKGTQKWELYDMEKDRTEMNDLSDKLPEQVATMDKMYNEWAKNNQVVPWAKIQEKRNSLAMKRTSGDSEKNGLKPDKLK